MRTKQAFSVVLIIFSVFLSLTASAQLSGYINRQATSVPGRAVLDPNSDGYTSATTSGFGGNDVTNSEIIFKSIPAYFGEPYSDLVRGPNHLFSDYVPDANGNGFYSYYDGTNMIFRFRIGSIMSGSKGYSVLIDTDGKFGATGSAADPNYLPATTGTNGNPGFEIEIVLETNFRVAIYNVDGTSSPTLVTSYAAWQDKSQVSIAATNDNGDPDFYIDFFIPFSDLAAAPFNLTTNSSLRFAATTVMSPQAAIGGPRSDIYGATNWEDFIKIQPPIKPIDLGGGGSGAGPMCTAAPSVNAPISSGTVNITGSWTKSSAPGAQNTATITVYKNGTSVGTVNGVTTGSAWSLNGIALVNGDVITARAQGSGESICLFSNAVTAQGCNTSNIPSTTGFTISCLSNRGIEGTFVAGNEVTVYFISPTTLATSTLAGPATNSPTFGYSGTNWYYNGVNYNGSQIPSACSGGAPDMNNGAYYATTNVTGQSCQSEPVFGCLGFSNTATPVITQTVLYNNSTVVSGTAMAGAQVTLWVNGQLRATNTATGGAYSFSSLTFSIGDVVAVRAIATNNCMSATATLTVTCYTKPPVINADNNNQITAGLPITGTSTEPAGTTIRVYTSTPTLVATTVVQANGTWSTGNAGTTPSTYNSVSATVYYATAQNGTCGVSTNSANATATTQTSSARCGTITGPVTSAAATVSGTLTGSLASTTVNLYIDGVNIGSTTTNNTSWTITVAANGLYPNGTLTIGVQESGRQEVMCVASLVVTCASPPAAPIVTPTNATIVQNQTITYTVSNAVAGNFYGIANGITGRALANGVWASANGNLNITTYPFSASGNYSVVVKATNLSGVTVCTSTPAAASVDVSGILPVNFLSVSAAKANNVVVVRWAVSNEQDVDHYIVERSADCVHFTEAGKMDFKPSNSYVNHYSWTDAFAGNGKLCYRIKQVDLNGKFHYSNIVLVQADTNSEMKVSPNPAIDQISIFISSATDQMTAIELIDMSGRIIKSQRVLMRSGSNVIAIEDLGRLHRGNYVVKFSRGNSVSYQKIILQ